MTSFGYRLNPRYAIKECSSCGTLYTRDCSCSKGNVEDKILVPKPPKNCARCARCGHPVDGQYCQGCTFLQKKLEEDLVTHFQGFQNTFESSDDSTNVVNIPLEPFVVKQDHKNALGDGEGCQRCTCKRCGSGLSKGLCLICGNNQNSPNDSLSISANSSHNPPHIDERCFECGDALDGIFCQRCACKSCGKSAHIGYNCPPKVSIISNPEPCNQTMNNEPPQTLLSFDSMCYSDKEISLPCVSKPNFVDESSNIFNTPPQPPIYSCEFCGSSAQYGHYYTPQAPFINPEPDYSQDFNFLQDIHDFQQQYLCCDQCGGPHETFQSFSFYDDHIEEIRSGSTTTQSDISLPEYDSFIFDLLNDQFPPTDRCDFTHEEFGDELAHIISLPEYDCFYFGNLPDPGELISSLNFEIRKNLSYTTCVNLPVEDDHSPLLVYVVWIFISHLTYPVIPPHLHSFGNEDTIFDPGITINRSYSFKLGLSHRCGTFNKFNTHRSHLNESLMEMLFSTFYSP
nr:hypothetical protein [Tanacetum cinerariifolium]